MDWAVITSTIERLETLEGQELEQELEAIKSADSALSDQIEQLRDKSAQAASFMQTSMPGMSVSKGAGIKDGTEIGVWRVGQLLGAGGMGEVYLANRIDGMFEQQAALKIAKTKTKAFREQFEAERQRLAQLEHPNIARIIDGGSTDAGAPYLTMEYVDGAPITAFVDDKRLDRAERLALITKLCSALSHAHSRLILHRDIKHDNVLINADGEVRLIDFGVASLLDDHRKSKGRGPLTLAYAAPEQLHGETVSAATDIFAIGMLTHLIETGGLPRRQADGGVAIDGGRIGDVDLAAVLAKATASDPADRYASVDALRDDLQKFAGGFPVAARPVSSVTRFKKMVARNKLASAMSGAAAAAVIAGVIGVSVFAVRANEEANASRIAQQKGANTIEYYETLNAGFIDFIAGIDPQSPEGKAVFGSIAKLEERAVQWEQSDPQKALQTYIFLAEVYADAGMDLEAATIGQKLASQASQLSYAPALTLSSLIHPSEGLVENQKLLDQLDRLYAFFSRDQIVHSFDIAHNRCVRARLTRDKSDERVCLELATQHLSQVDSDNYAEASGNLTLSGYAMESARSLQELGMAKNIAEEAIKYYASDDRPTPVPEANFWLGLSDIAQMEEEWSISLDKLNSASRALESSAPAPYLEIAVNMELAQTHFAMANYAAAQVSAEKAKEQAVKIYGDDHYQVRDAHSEIARALGKQGHVALASQMLEDVISAETKSDNDPAAIKRYGEMLASVRSN